MPLVPIDLDKLKSLAEDRGLTIDLIMKTLEVKSIGGMVEPELKGRIWSMLKQHEPKIAEVKTKFPQSNVFCVRTIPE